MITLPRPTREVVPRPTREVVPRQTGTASRLNNAFPSADKGFHRPLGPVNRRRRSVHFQ